MEQLLEQRSVNNLTRKFTNMELLVLRNNINRAVFNRVNQRQHVADDNISRVMLKLLKTEVHNAGYEDIFNIKFINYCPEYVCSNNRYPEAGELTRKCSRQIKFAFKYGEIIKAKRARDDHDDTKFNNIYYVKIKSKFDGTGPNGIRISITPPIHHVQLPPYETNQNLHKIKENAKITWILDQFHVSKKQQCSIPNCIIKTKLPSIEARKSIYGVDLLKTFVDFFITRGWAKKLMIDCMNINRKYRDHFIAGAQSATLCFLMIGRFHSQHIITQNSTSQDITSHNITNQNIIGENIIGENIIGENIIGENIIGENSMSENIMNRRIPYDVIRHIAKFVWASRYDNKIWGIPHNIKLSTVNTVEDEERDQKYSYYDEDHYSNFIEGPHDWTPWFIPRGYNTKSFDFMRELTDLSF